MPASINCILIIPILHQLCATMSRVVHLPYYLLHIMVVYDRGGNCGPHNFWVTGINGLPYMIPELVLLYKKNINTG